MWRTMSNESPTIGFLVAAGERVGGGHLMRCLAMAQALQSQGARALVFSAPLDRALARRCDAAGVMLHQQDPLTVATVNPMLDAQAVDLLVIDGYDFGEAWRQSLRRRSRPLVVVDDLNNPPVQTADAIINALPGAARLGYETSAPNAALWLGETYAPLGPAFAAKASGSLADRPGLLLNFGASDPMGYTVPVLRAMLASRPAEDVPRPIWVVTGPAMSADRVAEVAALAESGTGVEHLHDVADMHALMSRAGLAVSALGTTVYELAATAVPTLAVAVADNQRRLAETLAGHASWCQVLEVGPSDAAGIARQAWGLWQDLRWRESAIREASGWVDGLGSRRLAQKMLSLIRQKGR